MMDIFRENAHFLNGKEGIDLFPEVRPVPCLQVNFVDECQSE